MTQEKDRENFAFTDTDLDIIRRVANGRSNAQISTEINLSVNILKIDLRRIMDHMGAENRAHVAALALKYGLISPDEIFCAPARTRLWPGSLAARAGRASRGLSRSAP